MTIYGILKGEILTSPPEFMSAKDIISKIPYEITLEPFQDENEAKQYLKDNTNGVLKANIKGKGERILHIINENQLYSYNDHQGEWGIPFGALK